LSFEDDTIEKGREINQPYSSEEFKEEFYNGSLYASVEVVVEISDPVSLKQISKYDAFSVNLQVTCLLLYELQPIAGWGYAGLYDKRETLKLFYHQRASNKQKKRGLWQDRRLKVSPLYCLLLD
jgi:hypothetical protein